MDKKKINFKSIILLILVLLTVRSYSQTFFTKDLKWVYSDSLTERVLQDTNQIVNLEVSSNPYDTYKTENIWIKNHNIFILIVDFCSGIYCLDIYVYKKENKQWRLVANSRANLKEQLIIEVDKELECIRFKTKTAQIGKLPFGKLELNNNNR